VPSGRPVVYRFKFDCCGSGGGRSAIDVIERMFDAALMTDYANAARPPRVPVRPGTQPYPVLARLVRVDGTETWAPATVVRAAPPDHVMVRITGSPDSALNAATDYVWLADHDVVPAQRPPADHDQ